MGLRLSGPGATQLNNAFAGRWQGSHAYLANDLVLAPDGTIIQRNADGTSRASYDATEQAAWTGKGAALPKVAATATTSGAAVVAKHNPTDATSGTLARSLPTGQAEGTEVSIEKVDPSVNLVNVTGNIRGVGASTLSLSWQYESIMFRADSTSSWWPVAGHKTKTALDKAYVGKGSLVLNVKDYGAVGDNTTDDSAAIQAAIDACDANRGGTVYFPQGRYRIATGLVVTYQGTELVGQGMPGIGRSVASGSSRIVSDNGITAITCNSAGTSHQTLGYAFRRLHVVPASGATTGHGIVVNNAEGCIFEDLTLSDFIGGTGILIDGKSGNAQYATLTNVRFGDSLTGLKLQGTGVNGTRLIGCYFQGAGNTPRAGSVAIAHTTGDTFRAFGTVIQGWETGYYCTASAVGSELHGLRFEVNNTCLRLGSSVSKFTLFGGSFVNSALGNPGSGNIGIQVDAGATGVTLMPTVTAGLGTAIVDNGTATVYPFTAAAGTSLANSSNMVTADVTMTTAGTYYDGPSLTLAPGTWLLTGSIQLLAATSALRQWDSKLWDGTTVFTAGIAEVTGTAAAGKNSIYSSAIVTLGSSTTVKISVASTVGGDTLRGTSTKGSYLNAVKIA